MGRGSYLGGSTLVGGKNCRFMSKDKKPVQNARKKKSSKSKYPSSALVKKWRLKYLKSLIVADIKGETPPKASGNYQVFAHEVAGNPTLWMINHPQYLELLNNLFPCTRGVPSGVSMEIQFLTELIKACVTGDKLPKPHRYYQSLPDEALDNPESWMANHEHRSKVLKRLEKAKERQSRKGRSSVQVRRDPSTGEFKVTKNATALAVKLPSDETQRLAKTART